MSHPLEFFHFCPHCGSEKFGGNNEKSKKCTRCGFVYYANPSAAVVAVIENEKGELLVARRAKEPAKGMLDLPGGFCDMDETAEGSVRREVKEETMLDVGRLSFLFSIPNIYVYSGMEIHTMDLFFHCKVDDFSRLSAKDDVAELFFAPIMQLNPNDFGLTSIRKGIEKLQKMLI